MEEDVGAYWKHLEEGEAACLAFFLIGIDEAGNVNTFEVLREENDEEDGSEEKKRKFNCKHIKRQTLHWSI